MGPGESASGADMAVAFSLGALIAKNGWILLSGGRATGVMGAVNKGYKSKGGTMSVGISPVDEEGMSDDVDLIISTNMRSGRNYINTLSSDILVAVGDLSSAGTLSEVALGLIKNKPFEKKRNAFPVILLGSGPMHGALVKTYREKVLQVNSPEEVINRILALMKKK